MKIPRVRNEPGWVGAFTRWEAPGALANGTKVVKIVTEEKDAHPVGARATVLGSLPVPAGMGGGYAYFVEWEDAPRLAVGVMGWKIAPVEAS